MTKTVKVKIGLVVNELGEWLSGECSRGGDHIDWELMEMDLGGNCQRYVIETSVAYPTEREVTEINAKAEVVE